jgi:DNA-binding GntR family transcriptional regulator
MQHPSPLDRPPSLTDAVVDHIRDGIIHGEYAPGQTLAEAPLAQALGTSRGTVREAMRVLANLGLVSRSSHREPVVSLLTPDRAEEIYTLRALLESFAARLAVENGRVDEAALERLSARAEAIGVAGSNGTAREMVEADMAFHRELSALAGHELLLEHLAAIQTHSRRLLMYSDLYSPDVDVVVRRHRDLLAIVRSGDPEAVERAVADHIGSVGRTIASRMSGIAAAVVGGDGSS